MSSVLQRVITNAINKATYITLWMLQAVVLQTLMQFIAEFNFKGELMQITLNTYRENETDTTVFFTLMDGDAVFKWHADIQSTGMSAEDIQLWLNANLDKLRTEIYRKQYPEISFTKEEGKTELQLWQAFAESTTRQPIWKDTHNG